ncbi:MAG: tetratricopeptide repeat protein, partial [Acidobacteriota bacterium]
MRSTLFQRTGARGVVAFIVCLACAWSLGAQESTPEAVEPSEPMPIPASTAETAAAPPGEAAPPRAVVSGEIFYAANSAYEEGSFEQAIDLYRQILAAGHDNGHVHYNLGNAFLRNGELGRAIASYRRSASFLPREQDIQANLEFARKSRKDAIEPPQPGAAQRTLFFWHYALSRAELGTLVVILNALFWGILILRIFRRGSEALRWITIILLILLLITGGSLAIRHLRPQQIAVIVPQEVDVRSGTNKADLVLFKLHAGTEVRVVDRREGTLRIALPDEGGGWIEAEHAD